MVNNLFFGGRLPWGLYILKVQRNNPAIDIRANAIGIASILGNNRIIIAEELTESSAINSKNQIRYFEFN